MYNANHLTCVRSQNVMRHQLQGMDQILLEAVKDKKESVRNSQCEFRKGNFCLSNLIVFYDEMAEGGMTHPWSG